MRGLETQDVFAFVRMIDEVGIKDQLKTMIMSKDSIQDLTAESFGYDLIFALMEGASKKKAEESIYEFFANIPSIAQKLKALVDVGLGYVQLGQSAVTLSGGESQRMKLATELARKATGRTIYILDEPTTGLHAADVHKLIDVLQQLVDAGNTVLVIEHNLDVIKTADYIIDLGPEGGDEGGYVVASGTPEEVAQVPGSYTGQYLKRMLEK